jgi:hypothetical protein
LTHQTTYVALEVLEHLADDVALVKRIPPRAKFVFSVPNFWSTAHVRIYNSVGVAFERFGAFLEFKSWEGIPAGSSRGMIHLYETFRRGDSW